METPLANLLLFPETSTTSWNALGIPQNPPSLHLSQQKLSHKCGRAEARDSYRAGPALLTTSPGHAATSQPLPHRTCCRTPKSLLAAQGTMFIPALGWQEPCRCENAVLAEPSQRASISVIAIKFKLPVSRWVSIVLTTRGKAPALGFSTLHVKPINSVCCLLLTSLQQCETQHSHFLFSHNLQCDVTLALTCSGPWLRADHFRRGPPMTTEGCSFSLLGKMTGDHPTLPSQSRSRGPAQCQPQPWAPLGLDLSLAAP